MALQVITSNRKKFSEMKQILSNIEQLDMDLVEIQSLDPHEIIKHKLAEAQKHHKGEFIVEDTSLYLDAMNGLPGPFIKWFLETIGNKGLVEIAEKLDNHKAHAITMIGYSDSEGNVEFFEGRVDGKICSPRGENLFGWDCIFMLEKYERSWAELTREEKNKVSMRSKALKKLKSYLDKRG
ncbi:RdgB/HAM1 family non-canonical purine NTP pyrophosphatase [Candidatus Woesearchaeota archaeon]|nr:RdgB/HAM1 family non-canonical purine NTP pyrophosphatase [Candidatus Woesearchaeota archaeon]